MSDMIFFENVVSVLLNVGIWFVGRNGKFFLWYFFMVLVRLGVGLYLVFLVIIV